MFHFHVSEILHIHIIIYSLSLFIKDIKIMFYDPIIKELLLIHHLQIYIYVNVFPCDW